MSDLKQVPFGHMDYKFEMIAYGVGGNEHLAVVLGRNTRDSTKDPGFVVWWFNRQGGGFSSGQYTNDEDSAVEVFMERAKNCRGME